MYLFFDTETTGLPIKRYAPVSDLNSWPRLVQLAWSKYDDSGKQISSSNYIIKPQGFTIPPDSTEIHGISTERAKREGNKLKIVLNEFLKAINKSRVLVAHNMEFDEKIVGAEFLREKIPNSLLDKQRICTMKSSAGHCKIPGNYDDYKWPNLSELHNKLFGTDFEETHNAIVDVEACARCFFELKKLRIIKI